jgi:hypothetical protein
VTKGNVSAVLAAMGVTIVIVLSCLAVPEEAQAIPAFARKYDVNCNACHTAPPVLNTFGQRFLENGYQLPGTEDGGFTGKKKLGEVTLDDVGKYLAFRLVGNAVRNWSFKQQNPAGADAGVVENKTEFTFPENFTLFAGGTVAKNVGFMVELGHDVEAGDTAVERGFVSFNNLGAHNLAHLRVGKFDPSAFYSVVTIRQQLNEVGESTSSSCATSYATCSFNRIGLAPSAFATKFYGLYDRSGTALSPFTSSLYNSGGEMGIDVHGRPFGNSFLYQVGILNGANENFGDSNKGKDVYAMLRYDYAQSDYFAATLSGFVYQGNSNAQVQSHQDVNWNRYGVSARATYQMIDLYAAYAVDRINHVPSGVTGSFDATATGVTVGADSYVTSNTLLSLRYDNLDAGGMLDQRASATFLGVQAKQYLLTNVAIFARNDVNLRKAEGGETAARNLRNAFFAGIDIIF